MLLRPGRAISVILCVVLCTWGTGCGRGCFGGEKSLADMPPPEVNPGAASEALSQTVHSEEPGETKGSPLDLELERVMESIRERWARINTLRAKIKLTANAPSAAGSAEEMQGMGVYEFQRDSGTVRTRMEINWRLAQPPESLSPANPVSNGSPSAAGSVVAKVLEVFDGENAYTQTTIPQSPFQEGENSMPPMVVRGTSAQLDARAIPGRLGNDLFDPYLEKGWNIELLPETVLNDKPVYSMKASFSFPEGEKEERKTQTLYFDKETGVPVKIEYVAAPFTPAAGIEMNSIEINPVIRSERFVYEPPPGAQVYSAEELQEMLSAMGTAGVAGVIPPPLSSGASPR